MISEAYTVYELHSDFLKSHSMSRWVIAAAQKIVDGLALRKSLPDLRRTGAGAAPVLDVESSRDFHGLWSALSFLFLADQPAPEAKNLVPDDAEFGHGFAIAGAVLLHMLGQREPFELFDFSYHVLNVAEYEANLEAASSSAVGALDDESESKARRFVAKAAHHRQLNRCLFAMLESLSAPGYDDGLPTSPSGDPGARRVFPPTPRARSPTRRSRRLPASQASAPSAF